MYIFFIEGFGDHRDLHVLTHSFPTRRSSDLGQRAGHAEPPRGIARAGQPAAADLRLDKQGLRQAARPGRSGRDEAAVRARRPGRSEEHTSELQSLMRISYAVFCLKKKKLTTQVTTQSLRPTLQHQQLF